jgi:hypothetical protein
MNFRHLLLAVLLGLCMVVSSGCPAPLMLVGGAAAGGTVGYVAGELTSTQQVSLERAWEATQGAMGDLGYAITNKEHDPSGDQRQLTARAEGDKKVTVTLVKKETYLTQIGIRVGTFGDEERSIKILESIKKRF